MSLQDIGNAIGSALQNFGEYSAQAASRANAVSFGSQNQQGAFNQSSANIANALASDRTLDQYAFNSAQAAQANQFSSDMWDRAAAWNEAMWERQAEWQEKMWQKSADWNSEQNQIARDFNSAEALKNRQWQQQMSETAYQRAVTDMEKAGINPILAAGGISTGIGSGSAASIGNASIGTPSISSPSMGAMSGQMASGGLLNGQTASEGNFQGQMEYLSGNLGLISAAIGGISSAFGSMGKLGDIGKGFAEGIGDMIESLTKRNPSKVGEGHSGSNGHFPDTKKANELYNKSTTQRNRQIFKDLYK